MTATTAARSSRTAGLVVPGALLTLAAAAWTWSGWLSGMPGSLAAFELAWAAMMAAMMFPAIIPVVSLYARGAAVGRVAPLPFFVAGYLLVWSALGLPVYFAWQRLMMPLEDGAPWAGRVAGASFLAAGIWQLTPLKDACLSKCRSPMTLFMRAGQSLTKPVGALRAGGLHGLYCVGCCWGLMAVLVAVGTMNLLAMVAVAALIFLEKNAPRGAVLARAIALPLIVAGCWLLLAPTAVTHLV